jgi:hypothetical protein
LADFLGNTQSFCFCTRRQQSSSIQVFVCVAKVVERSDVTLHRIGIDTVSQMKIAMFFFVDFSILSIHCFLIDWRSLMVDVCVAIGTRAGLLLRGLNAFAIIVCFLTISD